MLSSFTFLTPVSYGTPSNNSISERSLNVSGCEMSVPLFYFPQSPVCYRLPLMLPVIQELGDYIATPIRYHKQPLPRHLSKQCQALQHAAAHQKQLSGKLPIQLPILI